MNDSAGGAGPGVETGPGGVLRVNGGSIANRVSTVFSQGHITLDGVTLNGVCPNSENGIGVPAGGVLEVNGGSIDNCGIFSSGGRITLNGVTLDGHGNQGFGAEAQAGGTVELRGSTVQGFEFGLVAGPGGFVEINDSTVNGDGRGLWIPGGAARAEAGSEITGAGEGIIVEGGRIAVRGSTVRNSLGLNYASSAEVSDSTLFGDPAMGIPSLSPGFSSSVRVLDTTMEGDVFGVRNCTLQFGDGAQVIGTIHLDVGCALELSPNNPASISIGDVNCAESDLNTQVRLSGVTNVGTITACSFQP